MTRQGESSEVFWLGNTRWSLNGPYKELLFDRGGLRLAQWRQQGRATLVKQGSGRTIHRVRLPELDLFVKHFRARTFLSLLHQTIRQATHDFERFKYNTAIAAMMSLTNVLAGVTTERRLSREAWGEVTRSLLLLLAPLAPHITEELWEQLGNAYSIHQQSWPEWDAALAAIEEATLVVQVNGKLRDRITVDADIGEDEARVVALASERVRAYTEGKTVDKVVFVPGRYLVSVVVKG